MANTLLELVAENRLRTDSTWEGDLFAVKRLQILKRHFDAMGRFVYRDMSSLSSSALEVASTLDSLFAELREFEAKEKDRLLWDRLRETSVLATTLQSIHARLHTIWIEFKRIVVAETGRITARMASIGTSWAEMFEEAANQDATFVQGLQDQTSDVVVTINDETTVKALQLGDVERLSTLLQSHSQYGEKVTFISRSPIAKGGYGAVYLGWRHGSLVAVKKLVTFTRELHKLLPRLAREFLSMRELSHPNILPVTSLCVGLSPSDPSYIISPWAAEGNARTFVKGKSFIRRLRVRNDVVHGDLKAANILMMNDGSVKLGDFGLSTLVGGNFPSAYKVAAYVDMHGLVELPESYWETMGEDFPDEIRREDKKSATDTAGYESEGKEDGSESSENVSGDLTMLAAGTPGWSAPEVREAVPSAAPNHQPASDVYSLGCTIYELMTEQNPPPRGPLKRPKTCVTGDSFYDTLWELITRCTLPEMRDRASLREVHLWIDEIWLQHERVRSYTPSAGDIARVGLLLRKLFRGSSRGLGIDQLAVRPIRRILDEARYWSCTKIRAIDRNSRDGPISSPPLKQAQIDRLRNITIVASDSEPKTLEQDVIDFSNIDHSITEHVFINIIRAGEVVLESRGYLADFLVSTEDITHIRGFPRKFRTYDVEPSGLQAAVGDRIEVMGRFLGIETWASQMQLYFGLPPT